MLGTLLSIVFSGFLIGALARLALPGPDPMPFWLTVLLGLSGSIVGGGIATAAYGAGHVFDSSGHAFVALLLEIGAAITILAVYRRYVQRRPLSGPGAYAFPTRGFGIQRITWSQMSSRLPRKGRSLRDLSKDPARRQVAGPLRPGRVFDFRRDLIRASRGDREGARVSLWRRG